MLFPKHSDLRLQAVRLLMHLQEYGPTKQSEPGEELGMELAGSISRIVHKPLPPDDPQRRCPNISKAKKLLGWSPTVTLEEGLEKTIDWFKQRRQEVA